MRLAGSGRSQDNGPGRHLGLRIPQRLSTHIVPGLWLTWLPDASWPCSITTWYPCQTSLGSLLCHAGSQGTSEPALCLAPLPFLVQEGAPCLCRETLRTHPSPNLCAVPKVLAEPAPAGFPSSSPTRGFSPSCSEKETRDSPTAPQERGGTFPPWARANSWGSSSRQSVSTSTGNLVKTQSRPSGKCPRRCSFQIPK